MAKTAASAPLTPSPKGRRRCPICGKPASAGRQPFCSARCANIDLGRWFNGNYRVATEEGPADETDTGER
jgi:uncharacterized protein